MIFVIKLIEFEKTLLAGLKFNLIVFHPFRPLRGLFMKYMKVEDLNDLNKEAILLYFKAVDYGLC